MESSEVRLTLKGRGKKRKLTLSDVMCPICFSILIEPVTMPCKHEMCMPCFELNAQKSNLTCPICRRRLSSWARKATKDNILVDNKRWNEIKSAFPGKVRKRLAGEDSDISLDELPAVGVHISKPGEIRKEYEETLKQFQRQEAELREQQERASVELIKKLQCQEANVKQPMKIKQEVTKKNEVVAKQLHKVVKEKGFGEAHVVAECAKACSSKTKDIASSTTSSNTKSSTSSSSSGTAQPRSSSVESHDSISGEFQYFKPIKTAPKTPPKQLPDGQFIEPKVVYSQPRKLDYNWETVQTENESCKFILNKLKTIQEDRTLNRVKTNCIPRDDHIKLVSDNNPLSHSHKLPIHSSTLFVDKRNVVESNVFCRETRSTRTKCFDPVMKAKKNVKNFVETKENFQSFCHGEMFNNTSKSDKGWTPSLLHNTCIEQSFRKNLTFYDAEQSHLFSSTAQSIDITQSDNVQIGYHKNSKTFCKTKASCHDFQQKHETFEMNSSLFTEPCEIPRSVSSHCSKGSSSTENYSVESRCIGSSRTVTDCDTPSCKVNIKSSKNNERQESCSECVMSDYIDIASYRTNQKQYEQDYAFALYLQELFDREAATPTKAPVKSEYNLRSRTNSNSVNKGENGKSTKAYNLRIKIDKRKDGVSSHCKVR